MRPLMLIPSSILATGLGNAARADDSAHSLDYFLHAAGPAARPTMHLDWVFAAIVLATCIIIGMLLLTAIFRKRPAASDSTLFHGGAGLRWISIGTGISTAILFAMAIYALITLNQTATPPSAPALTITVTGYDWWWKAVYENDDPAKRFTTANEIHIPTGVPVRVMLNSADVIHAFWVPQLAGKTEMIPGLTNQQWLQADTPGIYRGQCTQFCGVQHAHMGFEVIAQTPADYAAWAAHQRQPAATSTDMAALAGAPVFIRECAACHTVRGTQANGNHGPDLTHLASRRMLAAGSFTNTPDHLHEWIAHAQEMKPGARMPDIALTPADDAALNAYLTTLK